MSLFNKTKNKNKIREGTAIGNFILYAVLVILAFVTLYPVYYVLILSVSDPLAAASMKVYLWPDGFYLDTYGMLVENAKMWRAYANTIMYASTNTVLMLITCCLAAFPLTYKGLIGRKWINIFLIIPMYFGGGLIPTFLLITKLGMYNSPLALIIPSCVSIWYIILTKSYFSSLPHSLREAAKIDGANNYQILLQIFIPMSKPIMAVIAVYTIVGVWNAWFSASVYLPTIDWQPLQLYLRRVLVNLSNELVQDLGKENAEMLARQKLSSIQMRYAMIIFSTLPIMCVYPFFQKHFVKGVMMGSLKE